MSRSQFLLDKVFSSWSKTLMSEAFIQCVVLIILRKHGAKSRVRKVAEGKQSYGTERAGELQYARMGQ